jgi:hypothetical protein
LAACGGNGTSGGDPSGGSVGVGPSSADGGRDSSGGSADAGASSADSGSGGGGNSSGTDGSTANGGDGGGPQAVPGGDCPSDLGFPSADTLRNLQALVTGQTVRLTFDPRGDAKDYRVYALPMAGDISGDTSKNAVYRCGGTYAVPPLAVDAPATAQSTVYSTLVNAQVLDFNRTEADATLGYVFTTPSTGRIPVYALGNSEGGSDNFCFSQRWPESRKKTYTTSEDERNMLLDQHYRDDGIAFYVPAQEGSDTRAIYGGSLGGMTLGNWADNANAYIPEGPELDAHQNQGLVKAFSVLKSAQNDTEPLMRVFYDGNGCGGYHDELVAGQARFEKARNQGTSQPVAELHWSGITERTTLVVEAVDAQCPFQGIVSLTARQAGTTDGWTTRRISRSTSCTRAHRRERFTSTAKATPPRRRTASRVRVSRSIRRRLPRWIGRTTAAKSSTARHERWHRRTSSSTALRSISSSSVSRRTGGPSAPSSASCGRCTPTTGPTWRAWRGSRPRRRRRSRTARFCT